MQKNSTVIIVEDDIDDQEFLTEVFTKLNYSNELAFFKDGEDAYNHLKRSNIFPALILSDINMPKINGFQLREKLKNDVKLQLKCVPFIFFSTALTKKHVLDAYCMSIQGFFEKKDTMQDLENTIKVIMDYWNLCASPNDFQP